MKVLVTGAAGFIGAAVVQKLFADNRTVEVVGLDNINDYYDPKLKFARLLLCGINVTETREKLSSFSLQSGADTDSFA